MKKFVLLLSVVFFTIACNKDKSLKEKPLSKEEKIINEVKDELHSLTANPLEWQDKELDFLDNYKDIQVLGLGEATHGSANIFESKFRIFRYMAEHHHFKTFVIEADFAESIYLNRVIRNGNVSDIKQLMKDKMHFFTNNTAEVQIFLEWMAKYNQGKSDSEKINYYGDDCQFLTYHASLMQEYFDLTKPAFAQEALSMMDNAKLMYDSGFVDISVDSLNEIIDDIDNIISVLNLNKNDLVAKSSEYQFQLHYKLMDNFKQTMIKSFYYYHRDLVVGDVNYRDEFMAINTLWARDLHQAKTVLWAHNGHVCNCLKVKSQGSYLRRELADDYVILGFALGNGSLTSWGIRIENNHLKWIPKGTYTLKSMPLDKSFNYYLFKTEEDAFFINLEYLDQYQEWRELFQNNLLMLSIGAGYYLDKQKYNYRVVERDYYDMIIYLKTSTPSVLLNP